ncbi:hypothetical protein N7499_003679, partial [Penicillium canescens]
KYGQQDSLEAARQLDDAIAPAKRLVAFGKWDLSMPEEQGRRFPHWHADSPFQECEDFIRALEKERKRDGVEAYVDASKEGAPLYQRRGFVDFSLPGSEVAAMARGKKTA